MSDAAQGEALVTRSCDRTHLRYLALGGLYFSQGVPFGFFTQALPVILRHEGASLTDIGLSSLLALPWALKFAWAPLVDRWTFPGFGRIRQLSWIWPLNLAASATLVALAFWPGLVHDLLWLQAAVLVLNFCAATQDIASDSLAIGLLTPAQRGLANGIQVAAYRVGMLIAGGLLLTWHAWLGLSGIFACMAWMEVAALLPTLGLRLTDMANQPTLVEPAQQMGRDTPFLRRRDAPRILGLLVAFKFGEAYATGMVRPMLADQGASLRDIGTMLGTFGFSAGLAGALLGGAWLNRLGRRRALVVFGLLQSVALSGYVVLASQAFDPTWVAAMCVLEHATAGMATAALFTAMMDWSSPTRSGFDYTLQASTVVAAVGLANVVAGFSAEHLGYPLHFACGVALSLVGTLSAAWLFPRDQPSI